MAEIGEAGEVLPALGSNLLGEMAQDQNPLVGDIEPSEGVVLLNAVYRRRDQTISRKDDRGRLKRSGPREGQRPPVAINSVMPWLGFMALTNGEQVSRPK
jgi:hypothetical protein